MSKNDWKMNKIAIKLNKNGNKLTKINQSIKIIQASSLKNIKKYRID